MTLLTEHSTLDWAIAELPLAGEARSGDLHIVKQFDHKLLVGVVDGLGHGGAAADASRIAVDVLEENPHGTLESLVARCHGKLKGTRGVVMSLASIDLRENTATWMSVGNVEAVVLRKDRPRIEHLMLNGGVVGYNLPHLRPARLALSEGDVLVFATDGVAGEFAAALNPAELPQKMADRICADFGKGTDDALVLVLKYGGLRT